MMVFWVVAALLIAAALLFLIPPLTQARAKDQELDRDEINILLFKDQIKELEADLKIGNITQEQFDQAHSDLERNLLQDVKLDSASNKQNPQSHSKLANFSGSKSAIVVGLFVPVLAVSLYLQLGEGERGLNPENVRPGSEVEGHQGTIEEQVRQLQDHIAANPGDLEGRVMLARSYYFMKQYQAASEEFARAVSMTSNSDAQMLADYADALAMANGRNMAGKPYELVKQALQIQPFHTKSLWLAATATYQSKDFKSTLEYYGKLLQLFPEGSDNWTQMQRNIAEVKELLGMPVDAEVAALSSQGGAQTVSGSNASVSGKVSLDPALADKVSPSDTLFVFARAASGPRMPLAILRLSASDLPLEFTLDDSTAMNPAMKISKFPEVIVGARISKSGNAMPQSGDLSGATNAVAVGSQGLNITINGVVP